MTPSLEVLTLKAGSLTIELDRSLGTLTFLASTSGRSLLRLDDPVLFRPWVAGEPLDATLSSVDLADDRMVLRYLGAKSVSWEVQLCYSKVDDALDFRCVYDASNDWELNRLEFVPKGAGLNFIDVVNFRNRHYSHRTWPELLLGGKTGCSTDTYSSDWQFAPHPTAFMLRFNEAMLFWGAFDLPKAFGLYFSGAEYQVRHWYLDFGDCPYGLKISAGSYETPIFRMFFRDGRSVHENYAEFGSMLVRSGRIPDPAKKVRESWWTEPLYCTWIDQCLGSKATVPDDLQEQAQMAATNDSISFLDEALVRRAAKEIKDNGWPIKTILIDDGWQKARGQWEPVTDRFPNFRQLVDDLHAMGFRVVVWWNWAEIQPEASVNPDHLMSGGKRNRHGAQMRDYSNPRTQQEYLKPLFHQMFSSDPGCYDLDGVKTDFLADKVHADMPLYDESWRGEENYFVQVTRLFYEEMKRHKPDAVHIGCAGNYWLAQHTDINRTYDISSGNWFDHETRAQMLLATTPGCPVAYDFHNYLDGFPEWFASARRLDASLQIGNVLWYRKDRLSETISSDPIYQAAITSGLNSWKI